MSRALIDTHVFIWWTGEPNRLSALAQDFLVNPENKPVLSFASVWEMQIKLSLGKLTLKTSLPELVEDEVSRNGLSLLPIELTHNLRSERFAVPSSRPVRPIVDSSIYKRRDARYQH